jgi:hypothetical protein
MSHQRAQLWGSGVCAAPFCSSANAGVSDGMTIHGYEGAEAAAPFRVQWCALGDSA